MCFLIFLALVDKKLIGNYRKTHIESLIQHVYGKRIQFWKHRQRAVKEQILRQRLVDEIKFLMVVLILMQLLNRIITGTCTLISKCGGANYTQPGQNLRVVVLLFYVDGK